VRLAGPSAVGGSTPGDDFVSVFKPIFDGIVQTGPGVAEAVAQMIAFEDAHDLDTPRVYVSTAITSGGHRRDPTLEIDEVIPRNNRAATLVMSALAAHGAPQVEPAGVMVPTELRKVRGWGDTHYLLFYFAWLAGLSAEGTSWLQEQLAEPVYEPTLAKANDRSLTNEERWPHYRVFTEIALAKLALAEARPRGKRTDGSSLLLQLIDVHQSLGCRAEEIFADVRELDRLAPTFAADLTGALGSEIGELQKLGATTGIDRRPVELVPVLLR
jgi:hypothetical protein